MSKTADAAKPPREDTADHHKTYGLHAQRGCTDIPCLLLFIIFWAVLFWVASVVSKQGDPNRILYGTDMMGNICGHGSVNVTDLGTDAWTDRKYIWYPLQFNPATGAASVDSTASIGVCVSSCPAVGTVMKGYAAEGTPFYRVPYYVVLYASFPVMNRCIPNATSLVCNSFVDCQKFSGNNSAAATTAARTANATLTLGGLGDMQSMATDSINELLNYWWVVLVGAVIATILSFAWLFVLRRTVKPLIIITGLLLLVVLLVAGGLCMMMRSKTASDAAVDPQIPKYWLAGAISFFVVAFLYLCVMLFLRSDIMTACDIIEEASKVPVKIPTMAIVPLVCFVLILPFVVWAMFVAIFIQSCGDVITIPAPNVTIPGMPTNITSLVNSTASTVQLQNWRLPAHLFNLFMFLWTFGVFNAICFLILSLCATFWYFSEPGDHKSPPLGSVCIATVIVLRNHLGTLFFGAFLVALVQIIRVILLIVEKKIASTVQRNDTVKGIMVCLHCFLACLERLMKFINKNAYIMTAIEGSSFIPSAMKALSLLMSNALTVGAITIISEYVMIFGKLLITGSTTLIAFAILKSQTGQNAVRSGVLILAIVALFAYFISCLFVSVLSVCIDTILLCYCVDKADPSGKHYFPSDLDKRVTRGKKDTGAVNKEEPLLPVHPPSAKDLL